MLTRDQALVAASVLALALNQDLAHPQHVKTAAGAKWYDQPIGSLIIAKPHPHELTEHQKLVYAGGHSFAVPQQADVWVPGSTDLNSDAEVALADKLVRFGPASDPAAKYVRLSKFDAMTSVPGKPGEPEWPAKLGWKLLPPGDQKVPVLLNGKLAAWVPQSWKLYGWDGDSIGLARFARDPEGNWHVIVSGGVFPAGEGYPSPLLLSNSVKSGTLKPAVEVFPGETADLPDGVHPPAPKAAEAVPAAQEATVSIPKGEGGKGGPDSGTITVTADQLADAIQLLHNDKSTAVKQPLQKVGHPLWEMAYHDINKQVLKDHPELKIPPGTKTKHVGQVKVSVLHHLNAKLQELAATQAQHAHAEQAADTAKDQAEHAQQLAGHTVTVAGKEVTTEQVQAAIEALEASSHWKVLAILKDADSPLASGTWQGFKAWSASHPEHGKDLKAGFIAMLKEALGEHTPVPPEDNLHDQLDEEIAAAANLPNLIPPSHAFTTRQAALAGALIMSHNQGIKRYVSQAPGGDWTAEAGVPAGALDDYYEVTPEHVITHHAGHGTYAHSTFAVHSQLTKGLEELKNPPEPAPAEEPNKWEKPLLPEPVDLPADVKSLLAQGVGVEVNEASWGALLPGGGLVPHALGQAKSTGDHAYVLQVDGEWSYGLGPPSWSEKAKGWWDVTPIGGSVYYPPEKAAPAPPMPKFEDQHGWAALDQLIKSAPSLPLSGAMQSGSADAVVTHLLQFTDSHAPVKYFEMAGGKPLVPVTAQPPIGHPGNPQLIVYKVTSDHSVTVWGEQGKEISFTPAEISEMIKPWLDKEEPSAKTWDSLQPPTVQAATNLLKDFPPGSTLYQVVAPNTKNSAGTPGDWYVLKPGGTWGYADSHGFVAQVVSPTPYYENWAAEKGLKPVAHKAAISSGPVSLLPEPKQPGISVHGNEFPLGSKVYYSTKHASSTGVQYVQKPDGSWWSVTGAEAPEPYKYADPAELVAEGILAPVPSDQIPGSPAHQAEHGEVSDSQLLDLANTAWDKSGQTGHPASLDSKLAKALIKASVNKPISSYYIVKQPTGLWSFAATAKPDPDITPEYYSVTGIKVAHFTDHGNTIHALSSAEVAKLLKGEVPEAPQAQPSVVLDSPPVPSGPPVPVAYKGVMVGEAPAGSKLYRYKNSLYGSEKVYIKQPDGTWYLASSTYSPPTSVNYAASKYDGWLAAGKLEEIEPPSAEQVVQYKEAAELKKMLKHGAVSPEAKPGHNEPGAWGETVARGLTEHPDSDFYVWQDPDDGHWGVNTYGANHLQNYYAINGSTLSVTHHIDGEPDQPVPFIQVKDAIQNWVIPNSVNIHQKHYKYGHYYKAKGKAHLEISGEHSSYAGNSYKYGPHSKAHYEWHAADGSHKEMTPTAAASWLANGEPQWHAMPKGIEQPLVKPVKYAKAFQPGAAYQLWAPAGLGTLEVSPDGSALYVEHDGTFLPISASQISSDWLAKGKLLDLYGNTVVAPGIQPSLYHLFGHGTQTYSRMDLQHLLTQLEQGGAISVAEHLGIHASSPGYTPLAQFLADHGAMEPSQQYSAVKGLIHELLEVPENKAGAAAPAEVKYLKGLPPGIKGPEDIFQLDELGYAKSPAWPQAGQPGVAAVGNYYLWASPDLAAKIKEYSQEFGAGKVIGTHISTLTKDERAQWLEAFKQGDMVAVFSLDAKGGKVSLAHPGAPENTSTHTIIWGPWAAGETPAQMDVPGQWSDYEKVTLPKAEIDNYLIKANLQHAEYLDWPEKRSWVTWHRKKNQAQVDLLSQAAHARFSSGANTLTEPPAWSDNIKPATSYDVFLEDKTSATSWAVQALEDFTEAYKDDPEFKDAWQQWKDNNASPYSYESFLGGAYYNKTSVVQAYMDMLSAKEEAEKLKPKYHAAPGPDGSGTSPYSRVQDQFGWSGWWRPADARDQAHAVAVAQLAKIWGYRMPATRLAQLDGTEGIAQEIPKGATQLSADPDFSNMTEREVADIAREHVLDWALDNPGSLPGTFYSMPDGSLVGAGKGQALTQDLGAWDGLALNGQENLNGEQLSSALYKSIMAHQVSHKLADQAYIAAMRAASRISKTADSRMQQVLAPWQQLKPGALDVDGILARKNTLPDDIGKMWAEIYAKAGWKLPEVPAEKLRFGIHSGFSSPQFFDHVMAVKSYGTTAFFASPDIQHSSFLVWTELGGKEKDAPRLVRGETALRRNALTALTSWAKVHQSSDLTNLSAPVQSGPPLPVNKSTYYKGVINAAKAVSKHAADQNFEGDWTKKQLEWMGKHQAALALEQKMAEDAIAKGPESKEYAAVKTKYGQPEYVKSAAKHYLGLFSQIQQAKDNAGTFQAGDLPDWDKSTAPPLPSAKPAAKKEPAKPILVEKKSVVRELGAIDPKDGELKLGGGKTFDYPGSAWHITLPTGEVIEFQDTDSTGTKKSHTGRIRFKADATKGSASLENVRAFLEGAGVAMPEADDAYMELRYWRQLAGHLGRHSDWNKGKYGKVWTDAASGFGMSPPASQSAAQAMLGSVVDKGLDPAEEAQVWRKAWANLTSPEQVAKFVEDGGHLPHFKHWDLRHPDAPTGHPVWMRFDYAPGTKDFTGGPEFLGQQPLTHSFQNGIEDGKKIALSGGALSTEGRLRVLGRWISGMSSQTDMTSHGSSGVLYLRGAGYSHSHGNMKLSPSLLAQTSTRAYNNDAWGDVDKALTSSPFDPKTAAGFSPTNETDVEDGASLLDDILMVEAGSQAPGVVLALKDMGITQIRGLPVEQRIVPVMDAKNAELVRKHDADNAHLWFARPDQAWEPPPSEVVTHAAIETEAEQKGKSSDPGALKDDTDGLLASAEEPEDVASPAQISQMFYGADSKPSSVMATAPQVKRDLAKRLAKEMTSPTDDLQALDAAAGLTYEQSWGSDDRERIIAGLIKAWAQTNSSPVIIALQHEAAKLFGLSKEQLAALPGGYAPQTEAAKALEDKYGPVLREFLRAQWQLTQDDMSSHGLEDVTLYRIFKWNTPADWAKDAKPGDVIEAPQQYSIASWGYLQGSGAEIAGTYGSGAHSILVKATFPRQLMLSYPKTGFGSYNETEFTVLDAPGQWKVQKVT